MISISTAPELAATDGLSALDRARRNKLMLGLFLPIQNGGWSASSTPRTTSWHFDYNAGLAVRADELGFDLAFGLALWTGKGGLGGKINYWETTLDPLTTVAGLVPLTKNIMLLSTVHVLYGWHPLHLAKFGATLSHMSNNRWGLNIVTGYNPGEFQKFGRDQIAHDLRYVMAAEFTDIMQKFWSSDENVTLEGKYWKTQNGFCTPRLANGRPPLVNAASSPAGMEFAAKYCDLMFITSPAGADIDAALEVLPAHTRQIRQIAEKHGRAVRTLINPLVICRDTEKEVEETKERIIAGKDAKAIEGILHSNQSADNKSWKNHKAEHRAIGGNIQIFGTPEQVVDRFIQLRNAGVEGVQVSFFDFAPDLEHFGSRVIPLMKQAGLRV